jgi:hypothetical protein
MIKKSKKFRSFGPVIHAFLPPDKIPKTQVTAVPSSAPNCLRHWELCFGVFQAALTGCETIKRETLVGYAKLHRIGNTLRYAEKMGHGEYLRQGIMMLLHRELMKWLLDESNTLAQGIDALTYGAIEQGGHGLMFWKKKAQFQPCLLDLDQQDGGAE